MRRLMTSTRGSRDGSCPCPGSRARNGVCRQPPVAVRPSSQLHGSSAGAAAPKNPPEDGQFTGCAAQGASEPPLPPDEPTPSRYRRTPGGSCMKSRLLVPALAGTLVALGAFAADDSSPHVGAPKKVMDGEGALDVDVGHAAPLVVDWDGDGKKDLLVGQFGEEV